MNAHFSSFLFCVVLFCLMPLIPVLLLFTYGHAKYVQFCAKNRAHAAFLCSPRLPWLEVAEKKNKMLPSLGVNCLPSWSLWHADMGSKSDGRTIPSCFLESVYFSVLVLVHLISFQGHEGAWGWAASATAARCQEGLTDQFCLKGSTVPVM